MNPDSSRHRLGLLAITGLSLFGALFARLWFLQAVEGADLEAQVASNATRTVITEAPRGRILDRNGVALVDNRQSLVVAVDVQAYNKLDKDEQPKLLERLAATLSRDREPDDVVTPKFLDNRLKDERFSPYRPVPVAEDISVDQEIYFREQAARFPTVVVEHQTVRTYPYRSLAAHVLGYVGSISEAEYDERVDDAGDKPYERSDQIGKSGVERTYEEYLRGTPGKRVYEVDRRNRVVREIESQRVEPRQGDDVFLNLDIRVQYEAEAALRGRLHAAQGPNTPAQAGGVVVLDPRDGSVRAMASYPTYDPSDLVGGIGQSQWLELQGQLPGPDGKAQVDEKGRIIQASPSKLLNRAISGSYPAASTFKLATAYAGLKLGLITPQDTIMDNGFVELCGPGVTEDGCRKQNAGATPHGPVNLSSALTVSSDVYFYLIGAQAWQGYRDERLPDDAMQQHLKELGFGTKSGVDLPAEARGSIPDPAALLELTKALFDADPGFYNNDWEFAQREYARWNTGTSADLAIGQQMTSTPLQNAMAYAALANPNGSLWQPMVADRINQANSATVVRDIEPTEIRRVDWGGARDALIAGFAGVVNGNGGTAVKTFAGFPTGDFPVAGKTGTAQTGLDENENEKPENSLFVGWHLTPDPDWLASAMLEGAGSGAGAAAPTVRLIFEPIATGEINSLVVPRDTEIDAAAVAEQSAGIDAEGSD